MKLNKKKLGVHVEWLSTEGDDSESRDAKNVFYCAALVISAIHDALDDEASSDEKKVDDDKS